MLDFSGPPAPPRRANLLPMINVVFLLLIFFLISARMAPPEPFALALPEAGAEAPADGQLALYLDAAGRLGFLALLSEGPDTDDPILAALGAERAAHCARHDCAAVPPVILLRADAGAPVPRLAGLLPRLGGLGFAQVDLVTRAGAAP